MKPKTKTIETVKVIINESDIKFKDLLNITKRLPYDNNSGKAHQLEIIEEKDNYILGCLNTTLRQGIPPKHKPNTQSYEVLPINSKNGEGLGYSNVFIYDKEYSVMMYEFNQNGCYLDSFKKYILRNYNTQDPQPEPLHISFVPLIRIEAYERMLNMGIIKKVKIKIANLKLQSQNYLDTKDSLDNAISDAKLNNSDTLLLEYNISGKPKEGMPKRRLEMLYNSVKKFLGKEDSVKIEKFEISGYYTDPDDLSSHKDSIDLILDRYKKTMTINEPDIFSNPMTKEKSVALRSLYRDSIPDFSSLTIVRNGN